MVYDEPADKAAFERRYTEEHVPLVEIRRHAEGCGTTYTTYAGEVAEA
ncbi:hypothetical protein [Naumannella huperziae]